MNGAGARCRHSQATPTGGTVILVHDGGGHGRILAPAGEFVATLGWQAPAPGLSGYGLTRPAPEFAWDCAEWPPVAAVIATTLLDMSDPAAFVGAARWRWLGAASLRGFRLMPALLDRIALPWRWVAPMPGRRRR